MGETGREMSDRAGDEWVMTGDDDIGTCGSGDASGGGVLVEGAGSDMFL
jgi:hypothetical protein